MSTEPTTTREYVRALAAAVRDGELTPEQRWCLADLLHSLNTAVRLAPRAQKNYPDNDAAALGYLTAAWADVQRYYAELAATVRGGGQEPAA